MKEKLCVENIQKIIDDAAYNLKIHNPQDNAIWAASGKRGGYSPVGSITWQDWRDLELIPEIRQVVGHTPILRIITISDDTTKSSKTNVDTSASNVYMSELLEVDEKGKRTIINTSFL